MKRPCDRTRGCLAASLAALAMLHPGADATAALAAGHAAAATIATQQRTQGYPDTPGNRAFAEGLRLLGVGQPEAASEQFRAALTEALETKNQSLEAGSHRGLGAAAAAQGRHAAALQEHQRSLDLFLALADAANAARGHQDVGTALYWLGRGDEARTSWEEALSRFTALGDAAQQASLLYNLTFVTGDIAHRRALVDQALSLAQEAGDRRQEAQLLSSRADDAFAAGNFQRAFEDIGTALDIFRGLGDAGRGQLARVYTSLGRIYRAHAQFEQAIAAYRLALEIQRGRGDRQGQAQSARAIAVAYDGLGRQDQRRRYLDLSLEIIRATDAVDEVHFAETHLASFLVDTGDLPAAFRLLEGIVSTEWGRGNEWVQNTLARAYIASGQPALAEAHATRAVAISRKEENVERLFYGLEVRTHALMALGRFAEALETAREALDVIERLRQRLVPHDYMKRGFMDRFQNAFAMALESLERLERPADAMEVAERGRARAFSDLLLARQVNRRPEPLPARPLLAADGSPRLVAAASEEVPATRGGTASLQRDVADNLPSDASAPPATIAEMRRQAKALNVWIVAYWVGRATTWAWVMRPDGQVASVRIAAGGDRLRALVAGVWRPAKTTAARGTHPQATGSAADARTDGPAATRELHRLLISSLPQAPPAGSRLLVIPHGPLSVLSFAALQDGRGRYLVEDHAISYVPSASALKLSALSAPLPAPAPYLLLGAPATLPSPVGGEVLRPLPGARRELARVQASVGASRTRLLVGRAASESALREALAGARVLHLATHGVMIDATPLDSYLALDATGPNAVTTNDGRLTAREVYDLDVPASLVVLSACRSGLGTLTGDGLLGLARAFFYAGARSVVATLWDVADEPSARLTPRFHRALAGGAGVSEALRTAQVALLRDLRAGRVVVQGRRGPVPLPEHPSLWAGFVLLGYPD